MRRKQKIESETQLQARLEKEARRASSRVDEERTLDEMIRNSIQLHGA
jgi:hypothetical protein